LEITVSFLGIHKLEPDIDIGFSPALHLQCETVPLQASLRIRKPGKIYLGSYPGNEECQKEGGKFLIFRKGNPAKMMPIY
jgi:hypothetical protein